jgi:hypothetical protein
MTAHPAVRVFAMALLCATCFSVTAAGEPPVVLAGVTGGVCAAQLDKCMARCHGSGVCTARCEANDRACRVGGKPVYH